MRLFRWAHILYAKLFDNTVKCTQSQLVQSLSLFFSLSISRLSLYPFLLYLSLSTHLPSCLLKWSGHGTLFDSISISPSLPSDLHTSWTGTFGWPHSHQGWHSPAQSHGSHATLNMLSAHWLTHRLTDRLGWRLYGWWDLMPSLGWSHWSLPVHIAEWMWSTPVYRRRTSWWWWTCVSAHVSSREIPLPGMILSHEELSGCKNG